MRRNIPAFSHAQTERLISLNRKLTQLEYWCLQRAKKLVEDFRNRPAPSDWAAEEDFELESKIGYYRSESSEQGQEELILQADFIFMPPLKWYYLKPTPEQAVEIFSLFHFNWNDGVEGIPRLNEDRICWSFHDLHDHHGLNWYQVLEIERIWLDVHAIHQVKRKSSHLLKDCTNAL
ncbi:hypothetical protein [Stutzerimonas azotifigens]|uniref:hypothetical protein n=1 Tax=Stutzerimonas azotifigens TaxID=291995 RepID=UPI00126888B0|nr:hypothetical protein [Stutzerimonas azotifigens]